MQSFRTCVIGTAHAEVTISIFTGADNLLVRCWSLPRDRDAQPRSEYQWMETIAAKTTTECATCVRDLVEARDGPVLYVSGNIEA